MKLGQNFVISTLSFVMATFVSYVAQSYVNWPQWIWIFVGIPAVLCFIFLVSSIAAGGWKEGKGFTLLFLGGTIGGLFGLYIVPLFKPV